jgi:glutaredoxin-like protein
MVQTSIKVYGAEWCPDCHRSKSYLEQQKVLFEWIDVDQNPSAQDYVREVNQNRLIIPTIVFPDGSVLAEPSNSELAHKLREP